MKLPVKYPLLTVDTLGRDGLCRASYTSWTKRQLRMDARHPTQYGFCTMPEEVRQLYYTMHREGTTSPSLAACGRRRKAIQTELDGVRSTPDLDTHLVHFFQLTKGES